jgi:hypothetical protein
MKLTVTRVEYTGGTIATGWGVDAEGEEFRFAGDWRPLKDIADALEAGEEVVADVPSYAIIEGFAERRPGHPAGWRPRPRTPGSSRPNTTPKPSADIERSMWTDPNAEFDEGFDPNGSGDDGFF